MASDIVADPVTWDPPGPGTWELDTGHFGPKTSRIVGDLMVDAYEPGFTTGLELVGAPIRTLRIRFVNGRMYLRTVPLVGAEKHRPLPPKPVLWLLTRLHPEFRRRAKRSVAAIEQRQWLDEYDRWQREWKPNLVAANRRLGSVDVTSLTDTDLASHLDAIHGHLRASAELHFRLHVSDMGPIGRLLVAAEDWGLDRRTTMTALAGSSPATRAPAEALAGIRAELDRCGATPSSLDEVRSASSRACQLLDDYLAEYGRRLSTGYDIRQVTLAELPDVLLSSILDARGQADSATERGAAALDELRASIAPGHASEFEDILDDARLLYGLRDENGPLTWEWPAGILRGVVLEIARRLVRTHRLHDTEHVFDLTLDEMVALLRGSDSPTADEARRRCEHRMALDELIPPAVLGPPAEQPPIDVLPGRMPEMMRSVLLLLDLLEGDNAAQDAASPELVGTGIGTAPYRGTARIVDSAEDALDRVEPGDIVVTTMTVPTYNAVLAMAGGVVTATGGLLCHTAVIARELGIPAVVGVASALAAIPDGAEIEVDPVSGRVTVL